MMIRLIMIGLFLIYFWYFYFSISKPLPSSISEQALPPPATPQLSFVHSKKFKFTINNKVWTHTIPSEESYIIYNDRIIDQIECKYIPDEDSVEATGKALYDYFKENYLSEDGTQFSEDVQSILHTGQKFYFKCKDGIIVNLHTCPARTLYSNKTKSCVPIDDCNGQPDNTVLRHKTEIDRYISCQNEVPVVKMCPAKTFFMQNRCYPAKQIVTYCQNNTEPFLINEVSKVVCVNQSPYILKCPPNTKFFDKDGECEPLDCVGKPDNYIIPIPEKVDGIFKYVPGFKYCKDERVSKTIQACSAAWDPKDSPHHLPDIPKVFHNGTCQVPIFCENLFSDDPDTIVPLANFTKVLPRWSHSEAYDSLQGVQCVKRKLQVIDMPPGYRIKKFKKEKVTNIFPIQGNVKKYYDGQTIQDCPQDEHFNGSKCVPYKPFAFQHEGIDIFKFDHLHPKDDWLMSWHYSNENKVTPCPDTEPVYLSAYNKCSDTDCAKYPFLTQLKNLSILEKNFKCTFSGTSIKKEPIEDTFSFWNQRYRGDDKCTPGQNIFSGNFIWDKTVYATCDKDQPFVFCPSSTTQGIEFLNGKKYACKPPESPHVEQFHLTTRGESINTNEVKSIKLLNDSDKVEIDYHDQKGYVPLTGEKIFPENENLTLSGRVNGANGYVQMVYRYKVSYPPDVYYEDGVGHSSENYRAWLVKLRGYTEKPVNIPDHNLELCIEDYKQDG